MDSETHDPIDLQTKELRFAGFDGHWIRLGFRCAIWFVSKQNIIPKVSMSRAVISIIFFLLINCLEKYLTVQFFLHKTGISITIENFPIGIGMS